MNTRTFQVVVSRAGFFVAPITDTKLAEARISKDKRRKMVRYHGLNNGSFPGLTESEARSLANSLTRARLRRRRAA